MSERDCFTRSTIVLFEVKLPGASFLDTVVVNMENQSPESNACWLRAERTWSITMKVGVKFLLSEAIEKVWKGTAMVGSSIIHPWESTISAAPVYSRALWSETRFSSLTSCLIQDGTLLLPWTARPRRCIGTEVVPFSCLAGGVPCGTCFDLFTSSGLGRMRLFFSAINLHSDCRKHVTVRVSAVMKSCFFDYILLCDVQTNLVVTEKCSKIFHFFLHVLSLSFENR